MAKEQRFCTKERTLCGHLHEPKLFEHLVEGFYMVAPPGKRCHSLVFCQPRVTETQANSSSAFQPLWDATLPQADMARLMQGVIDGTLGEEATQGQGFVRAEVRRTKVLEQTPCKRVCLTRVEEDDGEEKGADWLEAEETINGALT